MRQSAGFTLIELLITITLMVILLTLSVVSLRSTQANARDEERKTDVAVIAQQLEHYYTAGSDTVSTPGSYPPTQAVDTETEVKTVLRDLDPKVLRAPDVADASTMSFGVATSNAQPAPVLNAYIYQPLTASGALCQLVTDECRKFTLFYTLETSALLQQVVSRNQ